MKILSICVIAVFVALMALSFMKSSKLSMKINSDKIKGKRKF